jgi:hypothetical protein
MTIQALQSESSAIRRDAAREYRRARVTMIRREVRRESVEEIRAAISGACRSEP